MEHIGNFLHFFSLGLGLISINIALNRRKRTGYKVLTPYIYFLISFNLVIFLVHFMEAILRSLVGNEVYESHLWANFHHMILILALLRMHMSVVFLKFCFQLTGRKLSRIYSFVAAGILLILIGFLYVLKFDEKAIPWIQNGSILMVHLTLGASMVFGSLVVLRDRETQEILLPEWVRPAFGFFIIYAVLGVVLRIFNLWADQIPEYILLPFLGLLALAFNGLNVLYLKRVLHMPVPVIHLPDSQLVSRFGITAREQEIIRYICQGKRNKEIAELLFISPITVRDHLSNIYRKTGVGSRTQLAQLFTERPAG